MASKPISVVSEVVSEQEELERLSKQSEALRWELVEAKSVAARLSERLAQAIVTWEAKDGRNGAGHSPHEIEQMAALRTAAQEAAAHVADLSHRLEIVENEIPTRKAHEAVARAMERAAEVWPPVCRALVEPVRALIPALKAQRAAWELLYAEQATGTIERETELALYGAGLSDDLLPELERWLAVAERYGFTTK